MLILILMEKLLFEVILLELNGIFDFIVKMGEKCKFVFDEDELVCIVFEERVKVRKVIDSEKVWLFLRYMF